MRIERYNSDRKVDWNAFVGASKNGTFLFLRDYMEYHADRFVDYSLLFLDDDNHIVALLPATVDRDVVTSHGGLTYGGVVCGNDMKTSTMLALFRTLLDFLVADGRKKLIYKSVPHVFHRIAAEEDLYALFVNGARLYRRDASSAIFLPAPLKFAKGKREGIRKATRGNLTVRDSTDYETFFAIGKDVMRARHDTSPVHTSAEMARLATFFPDRIKLFGSYVGDEMVAGVLLYDFEHSVHTQYMYNSDRGLSLGALDLVLGHLINDVYAHYRYFSFGVSTESGGTVLNEGLNHQKEMFGGRAVVHDFYELQFGKSAA
jgi:hypothetical protein